MQLKIGVVIKSWPEPFFMGVQKVFAKVRKCNFQPTQVFRFWKLLDQKGAQMCLKDWTKMELKLHQNYTKIRPKWDQDETKIRPKMHQKINRLRIFALTCV